jgi:phosphatidylserine/phosphatidylglycerophosphate/cardiolipin synthase-like enzyme
MIESLLGLPAHVRARLAQALRTGLLGPPYSETGIRSALGGGVPIQGLRDGLCQLEQEGISGPAVALALGAAERAASRVPRPDLVWSGPEVPGLHARDTRRVYEQLVGSAQRSLWVCTFAYYDGPQAFKTLADRMDEIPGLQVRLLLNIQRKHGDTTTANDLVLTFADKLWNHQWPGQRRPEVYYDPRSLDPQGPEGVLHAKAVVADDEAAFVTSANLTEAAFDRNIEVGVLSRDRTLAASLATHFRILIERELLRPLLGINP